MFWLPPLSAALAAWPNPGSAPYAMSRNYSILHQGDIWRTNMFLKHIGKQRLNKRRRRERNQSELEQRGKYIVYQLEAFKLAQKCCKIHLLYVSRLR